LADERAERRVLHTRLVQLTQRVFAIALSQRNAASSSPTLCRFGNAMDRAVAVGLHEDRSVHPAPSDAVEAR